MTLKRKRILFIRMSAIGDIIMASGIVPAFAHNPDVDLFWLADKPIISLVDNPSNVTTIAVPFSHWKGLFKQKKYWTAFKEIRQFKKHLHSYGFDIAIDSQGILKSGVMAWLSGAKKRIGLGSREGSQYLMTEVWPKPVNDQTMSTEYRFVTENLPEASGNFDYQLQIADSQYDAAKSTLASNDLSEKQYRVFCPFTTRPQKHWFNHHWLDLAKKMAAKDDTPIIILGGPADKDAAKLLMQDMPDNVLNWVGKTGLAESVAIVALAKQVVGVDTGLTHAGMISDASTIGLFGSTQPYLKSPTPNSRIICHRLACSPCRRKPTCDGRFECLRDITADEVIDAFSALN